MYTSADIEACLSEEGADQPISSLLQLTRFCQYEHHLERCYAQPDLQSTAKDKLLALKMYQVFVGLRARPTRGQLKVLTMVYEDMIRRSRTRGKLCCRARPANFRFEHSLNLDNLSLVGTEGGMQPGELARRLTLRAIYFHTVITQYSGPNQSGEIPRNLRAVPVAMRVGPLSSERRSR
jgi:hypothetical protein